MNFLFFFLIDFFTNVQISIYNIDENIYKQMAENKTLAFNLTM